MRISFSVVLLTLLSAPFLPAQSTSPASSAQKPGVTTPGVNAQSAESKIAPAKEADIRKLLDVTGARALIVQGIQATEKSIKPLMTNALPAGAYRDRLVELFFEKFHAKMDLQSVVDMAVLTYDKYLTHEEIRSLLQFYETPVGKKAISVLPQIYGELRENGSRMGEQLGRDCMLEVLTEHPELKEQMEAAAKAAQH